MRILLHIMIALAILGLGIGGYYTMKDPEKLKKMGFKVDKKKAPGTRPKRKPEPPMIRTRVVELTQKDHTILLKSQGEIRTHNATSLTPQISGRVVQYSENFEDGAYFNKGDVLLELETADYLTDVESAKAQLARAEASFAQEEARAKQALLNWKDAGFDEDPSDLVLRKPQLRQAEANVSSAKSSLARAQRNLARTRVRAPYDGRVKKRNVGLGQQVGASTSLGEIFSTDFAEVRLPLTTRDLTYYSPPNKPEPATEKNNVTFTSFLSVAEDKGSTQWAGTILRAEGELDKNSRQLFVIARIDDPFGLKSDKPALFIGQPVRAIIPAKTLQQVYTIPRKHLSELNEILVVREGRLKRVTFTPDWSNSTSMITRDGIEPGDLLCTTRLPYAPEGAPVEIIPEEEEPLSSHQVHPSDSR
ncbi:MAG: efflux RND transporter periplasmic adaptor subunit [Verrucomicrobiae bacterium]|nr:efflux RND transporter periplasmic adaptor subunit [Verrucomicrobiae bacterium]NNJ43391.1 efflux RND transporter periplasmic adaptor subunit [Akkermansiaceae bacterium]